MYNFNQNIPFYRQMIGLLRNALPLLDKEGREEVRQFIVRQKNPDGGFQDRGGRSDLYYSLFGGLMLKAFEMENCEGKEEIGKRKNGSREPFSELVEGNPQLAAESILKLRQFIIQQSGSEVPGFIEKCCLVLLQKDLKTNWFSRINAIMLLVQAFWKERSSINLSYQSFVLFLTLDAVLPFPRILKMGAGRMLERTIVDQNSPCSEVAANVFLKKIMNQDGSAELELLNSLACKTGGFKAFQHLQQADMLSTAIALFALNYFGYDLRVLKPACLSFIQQNYSEGAFLSGDGDQTADLEYTFYGMLALGVLAE